MAKAPIYGARRQTLLTSGTRNLVSHATPQAFGAGNQSGIGEGLTALSRGLGQAATAIDYVQNLDDEARVTGLVNSYSDRARDLTYNPESGYTSMYGENAVEGQGTFEADLESERQRIGTGLSPNQKNMYDVATNARRKQALDTGVRHAQSQRKKWFDDASTARLNTFASDALAMSHEPNKLAMTLAAARGEIAMRGDENGWSAVQTAEVQRSFLSGVNKNIILKNAVDDPLAAQAWLEAHRKDMTSEDQYALDKALQAPILAAQSQVEATRIMSAEPAPQFKTIAVTDSGVDIDHVGDATKGAFVQMQQALDVTLKVRSGFRTPQHNASVGGAKASRHTHGDAMDIDVTGKTEKQKLDIIAAAFDAGFTGMGVGTNVIHVDQARPRSWGYVTPAGGGDVPAYARAYVSARLTAIREGLTPSPTDTAPRGAAPSHIDFAMDFVGGEEGFVSEAFWDADHYRVGVSSDTMTAKDGTVREVRKGDKTTIEAAKRDQLRRMKAADKSLGKSLKGHWAGFNAATKVALTSLRYHYGSVPKIVMRAAKTGNMANLANTIESLDTNPERRKREADLIRTGKIPSRNTDTFDGPAYINAQVAGIADPKLRQATATRIAGIQAKRDAAATRARQEAKLKVERFIIQNVGVEPTSLPLELQMAIGVTGMNTMWNFNSKMREQGEIKTDEVLYSNLVRQQAEDPTAFIDVELFDYIDKLSPTDRRDLQQLQVDAIKDRKGATSKALTQAKSISSAMSIASIRLKDAGVMPRSGEPSKAQIEDQAQFQRGLVGRMREFQKEAGRVPTDYEVGDMVDQLLTPIVLRGANTTLGSWFTGGFGSKPSTDAFVFDAPFRADGETVELNVPYTSIPIDMRMTLKDQLTDELGRSPTEDEVKSAYMEFVLGQPVN